MLARLLALVLILGQTASVSADTLVLNQSLMFGKIISVGPSVVILSPGCVGTQQIDRKDVKRIEINAACTPRPIVPYSAGGEVCPAPQLIDELVFTKPDRRVQVSDYALANGHLDFTMPDGNNYAHGSAKGLVSITHRRACVAATNAPPADFCVEQRQWAVNFGLRPVFGNAILTQGVAIYLEDENGTPLADSDPMGSVIRDAFGSAITQWMAALQDRRSALPNAARAIVDKMISHSPHGYALLTPPQVVRVGCPDSATFVIRFARNSERALVNRDGSDPKAARAEVAGRTLLINGVRYTCWKSDLRAQLYLDAGPATDASCKNLVPILVHELGHAFGLPGHVDDDAYPSIMDSVIWVYRPTPRDADALAAVLMQPIEGAAMGRLDGDGRGVSVPPREKR